MTKLLITGANGQLGSTLKLLLGPRPDMQALFTDIDELDLTDARAVSKW